MNFESQETQESEESQVEENDKYEKCFRMCTIPEVNVINVMRAFPEIWIKNGDNIKITINMYQQRYIKEIYSYVQLRRWQNDIKVYLENEPNDQILWLVSLDKQAGLSWFALWLYCVQDANFLFHSNENQEVSGQIEPEAAITVMEITTHAQHNINYEIMEQIKDEIVCPHDNTVPIKLLNKRHLLILAKVMPNINRIPKHKLIVWTLKNRHLTLIKL